MPNKSEINRELVKAFNSILRFNDDLFTNCTVDGTFSYKEDHIVILFDKNMTINQRKEYLKSVKKKVIERFCPDESILDDCFYTKFFPFNFDQGKSAEDNKFLVSIRKEVISNLKFLLANEIARFATDLIKEQKKEDKKSELGCEDLSDDIEQEIENHVDYNIIDEVFDKGSYLYSAECVDRNLQRFFVDLLSSRITGYENGPKKIKDFLEEKGNYVYLKKSIFDNPKLVKDIVKHIVSLTCRCFDIPNTEDEMNDTLKFAVVDLIHKALPHLPINSMWHISHKESKDEFSILAPVIDCGNYIEFLNEKEVDHINNKVFGGTKVFRDVKNDIAERGLLIHGAERIYAIDFFNPDIAYCVMNKITESSVINEDYKLFIDPARVPAMKPQTLAPSEEKVGTDGPSADSGFFGSPKNLVVGKSHTGNSRKLLGLNYYDENAQRIKDDNSAKDSGFGASSARSSFNKPKTTFNQPSISQPDQCSAKKQTSTSKKSICCIL
ncbi:hypothetical protein JSQ73_004990 [Wolbachia endosymbiont of Anopheles demeilloni]|uniref:hypothetical protein n=1 Tax=Wolbachia endosymbiont of Anopheles demeilloni TaxID=2748871 RepID=UPI001BD9174B|nr:hypothetical protein [Wolbachia endosymbiont of Anopheles demeilloni]UIP92519.1 hypothetical protein JSQ73_004990 [Wolbachia endosymbiont of Anopheles demeilloni]